MQTDAEQAVSNTDLVIEAIVENLETKQRLFASLDKAAPRFVIITSLLEFTVDNKTLLSPVPAVSIWAEPDLSV